MAEKSLVILRGLPGSGKSSLASLLSKAICSADDYLINREGEYIWTESRVIQAHEWCKRKCERFMKKQISLVVIDNVSVKSKDMRPYRKLAKEYGYKVYSVIVENRHKGINTHNVSKEIMKSMRKKFEICL
ncbi:MAG: AAA family ATPase [Candidatus Nanoarchaeia archaeon]|nr:AAA family ATPase [Candidatus Nanoarchaeia archaeon]